MYVPESYRISDAEKIYSVIESVQTGHLITQHDGELQSTFIPWVLKKSEGNQGVLYAHMARSNPAYKSPRSTDNVIIVFTGLNGYMTPSYLPSKKTTGGRVVPTWNYEAIHVKGKVEFTEDKEKLHGLVSDISDQNEKDRDKPWSVEDAPKNYIDGKFNKIVGVKVTITDLIGCNKFAQELSATDKKGAVDGLNHDGLCAHSERVKSGDIPRCRVAGKTSPLSYTTVCVAIIFGAIVGFCASRYA